MEMTSNIFGRKMKLYGTTLGSTPDITTAYNAFSGASFLRYIDAGFIRKASSSTALENCYLFDRQGNIVSGTLSYLDSVVPNWQQMPILYYNHGYSGSVNTEEYLGLFPHAVSLNSYGYDTFYITSDDNDGVHCIYIGGTNLYFDKTDGSSTNSKFINYTNVGTLNYDDIISVSFNFLDPESNTSGSSYDTLFYAADSMKNSVYLFNGSTIQFSNLTDFNDNYVPDDDPYSDPDDPDDESGDGGGDGDHDDSSDPVDIPNLPSISATDTGFITLYNPSTAQLQSLANYMWSTLDMDSIKKLWADPMNCILGLSIIPCSVPSGTIKAVSVGNIATSVSMTTAGQQYVEVDCGSLNVNEYWGAYLDYSPYTKCEIFLPYCGCHPLDIDTVMDKTIVVKYHVDILSGACTAFVKCGDSVLYTFQGNCACSIPVNANDWTNVINGVIQIGSSIGSMVATGGASAPAAAGSIASTAINNLKPEIEKSGAIGSAGGLLANQKPYLIITRPRQARPANQNAFMGYPSFITSNLGSLSGYTELEVTHVGGFSATDEELAEIDALLKEGVFL